VKCLISAHDAGGAEVVSAWVRRHPENQYSYVLGGPAENIFRRKIAALENKPAAEMEAAVKRSDFVLTATSASSELETSALAHALRNGIPSATFLDYWWGFKQRFERGGILHLPEEIWVGDAYAFSMAQTVFPELRIVLKDNPYLLDVAEERKRFPSRPFPAEGTTILYLSQPINENQTHENGRTTLVNDYEAVKLFLRILATRYPPTRGPLHVRIRPHPAESPGKYSLLAAEFREIPVTISSYQSLVEDCANADWAVGVYTMALVVALSMGMKAFYCLPDGARPFSSVIPYSEIGDFKHFMTTLQ